MVRTFKTVFVAVLLISCWSVAQAKAQGVTPTPTLVFMENGEAQALILDTFDTHVVIRGLLAETTATLTFRNPLNRVLEGDLSFPLPEGATVSGYGLDIGGNLVEGVVVEQQKARVAFEKEVRKGVDPGLVEWSRGNIFRTRVYPIPASGTRTVMIRYVADLTGQDGDAVYVLPLNLQLKVKDFHLKAEVVKGTVKPEVTGGLANFDFARWEDRFVAEARHKDFFLDQDLRIALPRLPSRLVSVEREADDSRGTMFVIHETPVVMEPPAEASRPDRIGLFWDASLSRAKADTARELELLRALFARWGDVVVDVVVFRDRPEAARTFRISGGKSEELEAFLRVQPLDGGTALGALNFPRNVPEKNRQEGQAIAYDLHVLVSDGLGNLNQDLPEGSPVPLYTVAGGGNADHLRLGHLARTSGGEHLNLSRRTPLEAAAAIGALRFGFLGAEYDNAAIIEVFPQGWQPVTGRFHVTGRLLADEADIVLRFGYRNGPEQRVTVTLRRGEASETGLVPRFWAQRKVHELALFKQRNKSELLALGRRFGLVTPGTSLLVLETLEQHLEHDVEPPASRPEMRQAWRARNAIIAKTSESARNSKIDQVAAMWKERVAWWETEFTDWRRTLEERKRQAEEEHRDESAPEGIMEMARRLFSSAPMVGAPPPSPAPPPGLQRDVAQKSGGSDGSPESRPAASIILKPWDPKTPYIATLKAAHARGRAYESYLDQRAGYGDSPAYYLDVANWLASIGEKALSHRVLTSILDLDLENPTLLRIVAYRLLEGEEWDEAISILEAVLILRPEEPQSHRDLALALARRGEDKASGGSESARDLSRAMDLLHEVVLGKWDRFEEIELIALEELNRLLSVTERLPEPVRAAIRKPDLDGRLRHLLDLDLRIVLSWDADLTDIDLWVIEPSGEKAYYSNRFTAIGGNVSKDFTEGYGPEEYALRCLIPGTYRIQADYYGSSQAKLSGSATVKATVFTDYGRANEKRQELILRLPGVKSVVDVGSVELAGE